MIYSSPFYVRSPIWAQELMLSTRGWLQATLREGVSFRAELAEVERSQWLEPEALAALQLERVRRTVAHADVHVPFYRERFKAAGFEPGDLKTLSDMQRLPVMSKRDAFEAGQALTSEVHKGPRFEAKTSGTTGMAMSNWRDLHSINRENAFVWRQLLWAGMKLGDRRAWLRGDRVVPAAQTSAPFWRHNRGEKLLMMSAFHLSEATADAYLAELEAVDPAVFMAYPSAVLLLARHLVAKGRRYKGRNLRGMVTSSETISDEQRRLVLEAFGVRMFDWYGASERMTAIGTCEHGSYHVMADYSYTELLPLAGAGACEVVGTTFDNLLMPLIRYRLGDELMPADPAFRCACGRHFPVISHLVGRMDDFVKTPDGRQINMLAEVLDYIPHLLEGQVRQDALDGLTLVLALSPGAPFDEQAAVQSVRSFVGDGMKVKFDFVSAVPRTSNGKLRMVVRTV
jgi:phenylacetate-CoA ligase